MRQLETTKETPKETTKETTQLETPKKETPRSRKQHNLSVCRAYREKNKDRFKRYQYQYSQTQIRKEIKRISELLRRAFTLDYFSKLLEPVLGCDFDGLNLHLTYQFYNKYRYHYHRDLKSKLCLSWKTPLGTATSMNELRQLLHYSNLEMIYKSERESSRSKIRQIIKHSTKQRPGIKGIFKERAVNDQ